MNVKFLHGIFSEVKALMMWNLKKLGLIREVEFIGSNMWILFDTKVTKKLSSILTIFMESIKYYFLTTVVTLLVTIIDLFWVTVIKMTSNLYRCTGCPKSIRFNSIGYWPVLSDRVGKIRNVRESGSNLMNIGKFGFDWYLAMISTSWPSLSIV